MRKSLLSIAEPLMRLPTAPFREEAVRAHIREFCQARGMTVRQDAMGNLMADWGLRAASPTLVLEAHMDHPGFIMEKDSRRNRTSAVFYGRVEENYFPGSPVRVFTADGERTGHVVGRPVALSPRGLRVALTLNGPVKRGDLGMWNVPAFRVNGDTLAARVCDDLAGCAALLTCLDRLARKKRRPNVMALFTVAEEAGLNGAIYVCRKKALSTNAIIVSIETSREWPHARRGGGVVVRVGDIGAVFDPRVTRFMMHAAETVARQDRAFKVQRKLMDGGTCESSVYQAFGYATGAVCVPLGNYHNRNFARGRIAAERISVSDLMSMTRLFIGMADGLSELGRFLHPPRPVYREKRSLLGERFMVKRPRPA